MCGRALAREVHRARLSLSRDETMWKLLFVAFLCGSAQAQTALTALPCSLESSLISLNSNVSTTVDFENQTSQTVQVYWLNFMGARVLYYTLPPGMGYVQQTFVTHPWVITDSSNTCIEIFEPVNGPGVADIGTAVISSGAMLSVSSSALTFSSSAGGDSPPPQVLAVTPSGAGSSSFNVQVDSGTSGSAPPAFLTVQPLFGTAPASLTVSAATGSLAAGTYNGRILISNPADPSQTPMPVAVTFTVNAAKPQLAVSPTLARFSATAQTATSQNQFLTLSNPGGGGPLAFTITTADQSPWLSISPTSGQILPNTPASVSVAVNSQGLVSGSYRDSLQISTSAGSVAVPVSLYVAPSGPVLGLDLTGLTFRGRQGNGVPSVDPVKIFDNGGAGTSVNWAAELLSGSNWLSLSGTSGTSSPGNPSQLTLQPTSAVTTLTAGTYYALVKISDPKSENSPQFLTAVLNLAPADSAPMPDPTPQGLFFTGTVSGPPPASQPDYAYAGSSTPVAFQASAVTDDGAPWLSETSTSTTTSLSNPAVLNVSVNPAILTPGIYMGAIQISIGPQLRSVNVTLVVTPQSSSGSSRAVTPKAVGCTPTQIAITPVGTVNNFSFPASFPAELSVQLNDDCGTPITNGSVSASFSNGDPSLNLPPDTPPGTYSAVWQPGVASAQTAITINAAAGTLLPATAKLLGGVSATPNPAPSLVTGGALNNLNAVVGGALAPGTVAQVYGSNLASGVATPGSVPLPGILNGTQFLVGGMAAPLFYSSGTQLVVQIPTELTAGQQYSVVAMANGALSLPDTLSLEPTEPGVAAFADGTIIAQHSNYTLVSSTSPAHPNEPLMIYLVGMGATTIAVPSGTATPSNATASVTLQPTVQVDGQNATVLFAGLTPGGVGLYQINFVVPPSSKTGNLNVVITQGGAEANVVTLPVAQ
jgi:uncharacterized protein (TIGR03437 family)